MKTTLFLLLCVFAIGSCTESRQRIVGNSFARTAEFPYLVSIQKSGLHDCGGSLITTKHVLTAAHCVYEYVNKKRDISTMKIAVGTNTVPGGVIHDVAKISHHSDFVHKTLHADVAVIRLATEVTLSRSVSIIALPWKGQTLNVNQELDVCGFGRVYTGGPISSVLKNLKLYATEYETCKNYFSPLIGKFCASFAPGYGVCHGDSGGPITVNKNVIIGIASAVTQAGCGTGYPDLFTYVPEYLDFIHAEIANTN